MLPSHLTPRKKGFIRLTLFVTTACLMIAAASSFNASAQGAEAGLWRRFIKAPITTVQQVFGLAKSPTAAAPAPMFATITVNSTVDGPMATLNANTTCDLREAIVAANNNVAVGQCPAGAPGLDTIEFNIGTGTPTIALALDGAMMPQSLPTIIEPVNINGATGGATRVEINGANGEVGLSGLFLNGTGTNGSTIQSLVLNRFQGNGIQILNSSNNTIKNCFIGTNAAGTAALANRDNGVALMGGAMNNIIGGATAADRNILSGNGSSGVFIVDDNTMNNKVLGNYIGLNAAGTAAIPNVGQGVFIRSSPNNTIGGLAAGERNVISGNSFDGIFLSLDKTTGTKVLGNYIGTNAAGTAAIGNGNDGLLLSKTPNTLVQGNVISGNKNRGIWLFEVEATNNTIIGNKVGTDAAGTGNVGNIGHGIFMQDAGNNTIGGTAPGDGNIVAFNANAGAFGSGSVGIRVTDTHATQIPPLPITAVGNRILGNSLFSNELRGIELGVNLFPNVNDLGDPDVGPNNFQNYPVLSCAVSGSGTTTVKGTLNSLASTKFRIEFFSNDACHISTNGEGKVYLGFQNVTTDASGNATINAPLAATVAPGKFITSTATRLGAADAPVETSEFSACQAVTAAPTLAINNVTANEGNAGTTNFVFTVTLSAQSSCGDVTVNYATANGTATTANADYVATSGTLTFTGSNLTQTITVQVNGDTLVESAEQFFVNLTNASGAGITTAQGTGTITNDDAATVAINDVMVTEGNSGTVNAVFSVSLSAPADQPVVVNFATAPGSATAPADYVATSGSVTFPANSTAAQTITVQVVGETLVEANEIFVVNLTPNSLPTGVTIADAQGQGTINNDDTATVAINDVTVTEGNSGTVNATFTVTLSNPSSEQITVTYATANGSATTADNDYVAAAAGTVTFAPGETSKTFSITVNGDTKVEGNETFTVNLSNIVGNNANVTDPTFADNAGQGTINNDDAATVAINDVMVTEGNSGTVNAVFSVSLSAPADQPVVVNFATAPGSATAPADYVATSGSVTFPANSTAAQTITVQVVGETLPEGDETFVVNLTPNSLPTGVTIADAQGIGTIKDDDSTQAPALTASMSDPFVCNGVGGPVQVTAELTNPNPNSQSATFAVILPSSLTAVANSCTATTGTCTVTLPNQINWSGTLAAGQKVTISYRATVANGTPNGQLIVINSKGTIAGKDTSVSASGTVSCPPNTAPTTISASGQKPGSILVFPYYTSKASTKADTRLTLSNVGAAQTIVHLFLISGSNCQQADLYVCLTPYASISVKASDYDPETTGWMMAVAVDKDGFPVQNNALVGNAFLQEDNYIDNYSAVSFAARSADVATRGSNNTAVLQFNNSGYDAVPDQFAVELQSPLDAVGQKVVTVGLSGNLNNSALSGASQIGTGLVINGNEKPSGSFVAWLSGGCQATALINTSAPRVPGGMNTMIPKGQVGTMFFRIGSGVGLIMSPRGNAWSGIRGLQFTHETFTTITIPVFSPSC